MGIFSFAVKILRILFLLFLAFLLSINTFAYLLLSTTLDVFLEPQTYTAALARQNLSTAIHDALSLALLDEMKEYNLAQYGFSNARLRDFFEEVLPREWIEEKAKTLIADFLHYLQGKKDHFYGEITIGERKAAFIDAYLKLTEPLIDSAIEEELNKKFDFGGLPCTTAKECIIYCNNSKDASCIALFIEINKALGLNTTKKFTIEDIKNELKEQIVKNLSEKIKDAPNSIILIKPGTHEEKELSKMREFVSAAYFVNTILLISLLILTLIIAVVCFSIKSSLRWIGGPMFIIAFLILALTFFIQPLIEKAIENFKINYAPAAQPSINLQMTLLQLFKGTLLDVSNSFFSLLRLKAAIVAVISFLMILLSFFVPASKPIAREDNQQHS
jgi:hypothetical protein